MPVRYSVEEFRGVADIITLGNVYFHRKRTLAAVYTWAWCGSLCGYGTWRVFTKNVKGGWDEQHWVGCMTIASSIRQRGTGRAGPLAMGPAFASGV